MRSIKSIRVLGRNVRLDLHAVNSENIWYCNGLREPKFGDYAAGITISPSDEPGRQGLKIYDFRCNCVELARLQKNLYNAIEQNWDLLDHNLVDLQRVAITEGWLDEFGKNATVSLGEETNDKGRRQVIILSDTDENQPVDGLLATTRFTTGTGIGAYTVSRDTRKNSWIKEFCEKGIADSFDWLLASFTADDARILIVHRTISDGKFVMTDISLGLGCKVYTRYGTIDEETCIDRVPVETAAAKVDDKPIEIVDTAPISATESVEIEGIDDEGDNIETEDLVDPIEDDNEADNGDEDEDDDENLGLKAAAKSAKNKMVRSHHDPKGHHDKHSKEESNY